VFLAAKIKDAKVQKEPPDPLTLEGVETIDHKLDPLVNCFDSFLHRHAAIRAEARRSPCNSSPAGVYYKQCPKSRKRLHGPVT
jgi:hypothetical protein